jgi:tryptophan synthase beta chain
MFRSYLDSDEVPKYYYNINADIDVPNPINSEGGHQLENLSKIFSNEILKQEMSKERFIKIPGVVREYYQRLGRPSGLFRAKSLEEKLNTPAKIFYKREDSSPLGSHKLNSALPQAYYAMKEGVEKLTTETGAGQWGSALSAACSFIGIDCDVYMVKVSYNQKPMRKTVIEMYGGNIFASPSNNTDVGREVLNDTPNHPGSLAIAISEAIEVALANDNIKYSLGSVLNHVMLHQTIIGQEVQNQLEVNDIEPDVLIACVGGGSNFAGFTYPFVHESLNGDSSPEIIAVEPSACPTLTKGEYKYDFGDSLGFTPLLKMFTLGHDFVAPSIHAGGLRYHGMSPQISVLKNEGIIKAVSAEQDDAFSAAKLFANSEGLIPAPESSHAIKVVIDEALKCKDTGESKNIVFNMSGHGLLDLTAYS